MSSNDNGRGELQYDVVVNGEGQYSLWPSHRPMPVGWWAAGFRGPREECLTHIRLVWTDMRPLSLRRAADGGADE